MPQTPPGYEQKFASFIKMCAEARSQGISQIVVAHPRELGDNFDEIIESLSGLADAGLTLSIVAR